MAASLPTILSWFLTGKKPTQEQFWQSWQAFWHKDELIPISAIQNLISLLAGKADKTQFDAHTADLNAHNLNARLAAKANTEHTHSTDDIDGLTELLEDINTGPATPTEYGGVMLAGDLAGPANAPTVPGKLNKGANVEFQDIDATSEKHGFALLTRLGAVFRTPSLIWDETLKKLTIAGTQAVWEAYQAVTDGNMGIKALALAQMAFKIFDDVGNFLSVGTKAGRRYVAIHTPFILASQSAESNTEFISIDCPAAVDTTIRTFDLQANAVITIDVINLNAVNVDKKTISNRAQFSFVNNAGTVTAVVNAGDDLRYKQFSTIKTPEGYVTNTDARIDATVAGTVITLKFINPAGSKLTALHFELKYNITEVPVP